MENASSAAKPTVPYEASGYNFLPFPTNEKQNCLQCTKCDYSTRYTQNLNKHFNARHTNHTFECKLCGSKYKWKQQLKRNSIHISLNMLQLGGWWVPRMQSLGNPINHYQHDSANLDKSNAKNLCLLT